MKNISRPPGDHLELIQRDASDGVLLPGGAFRQEPEEVACNRESRRLIELFLSRGDGLMVAIEWPAYELNGKHWSGHPCGPQGP